MRLSKAPGNQYEFLTTLALHMTKLARALTIVEMGASGLAHVLRLRRRHEGYPSAEERLRVDQAIWPARRITEGAGLKDVHEEGTTSTRCEHRT